MDLYTLFFFKSSFLASEILIEDQLIFPAFFLLILIIVYFDGVWMLVAENFTLITLGKVKRIVAFLVHTTEFSKRTAVPAIT